MRALLALPLLAGCVSIADIDMSHAAPYCANSCTANYSACSGEPAPLVAAGVRNYQCKEALRACIASCPPR